VYTKAGLITTREEKHSGDTLLTGVNIKHTLFDDFRTHKTAAAAAANGGGEEAAGPSTAAAAAATAAVGQEAVLEPLLVEEVYVPSKEVKRKCL
jgi:translation initiation factor 2D